MCEQTPLVGVQHATTTRLSEQLGLNRYDGLRQLYADAVHNRYTGLAGSVFGQRQQSQLIRALLICYFMVIR